MADEDDNLTPEEKALRAVFGEKPPNPKFDIRTGPLAANEPTPIPNDWEAQYRIVPPSTGSGSAQPSLTEASRERLKLRSAFLSGLGSNIIATGTLGSILAFAFSDKFTGNQSFLAAALALLCFFGGFGLHFWAEATLQGTDE